MHQPLSTSPASSYFPYSNFHVAIQYLSFLLQHLVYSSIFRVRALRTLKAKHQGSLFIYYKQHVLSFNIIASLLLSVITYIPLFSCTCHCQVNVKRSFSSSSLTFFVPNIVKIISRKMRLTTRGTRNGRSINTGILVGTLEIKGPTGRHG